MPAVLQYDDWGNPIGGGYGLDPVTKACRRVSAVCPFTPGCLALMRCSNTCHPRLCEHSILCLGRCRAIRGMQAVCNLHPSSVCLPHYPALPAHHPALPPAVRLPWLPEVQEELRAVRCRRLPEWPARRGRARLGPQHRRQAACRPVPAGEAEGGWKGLGGHAAH